MSRPQIKEIQLPHDASKLERRNTPSSVSFWEERPRQDLDVVIDSPSMDVQAPSQHGQSPPARKEVRFMVSEPRDLSRRNSLPRVPTPHPRDFARLWAREGGSNEDEEK